MKLFQSQHKVQLLEEGRQTEKSALLEEVVKLRGVTESLKTEKTSLQHRLQDVNTELEKQCILCRELEEKVETLQDEVMQKGEEIKCQHLLLDSKQMELIEKETQLQELQNKYYSSPVLIQEETNRGLKEELQLLKHQQKDTEMKLEQEQTLREAVQESADRLMQENAAAGTQMIELQKQLECEKRLRYNTESKTSLNISEMAVCKEKEKQYQSEVKKMAVAVEKEKAKNRTLAEQLVQQKQQLTVHQLRAATMKSRISELEGATTLSQENDNKQKKECILLRDQVADLQKQVQTRECDVRSLLSKIHYTETQSAEFKRERESAAVLQSQKWSEFEKLAENMRNLSHSMLRQSRANTRKTAIKISDGSEAEA